MGSAEWRLRSHWILVLFPILITPTAYVGAVSGPLICVAGLLTWGATSPKGDILLQEGDSLEVTCSINLTNPKVMGLTSKHIEFYFAKHEIPDDRMQVTILDNSTAKLRVERMNASKPLLHCNLRDPVSQIKIPVCDNQIDVGYLPQPPKSVHCVARGWTKLNCTWTKPDNHILTSYAISMLLVTRTGSHLMGCPHQISIDSKTQSCEWTEKTEPRYRANMIDIPIILNGSNTLQPGGALFNYTFKNAEIVIPSAPALGNYNSTSPNELELQWKFRHFEYFKPGLFHQVRICPLHYMEAVCTVEKFNSTELTNLTKRIKVPYAYTPYRVEIRMKSQVANDTEEFWSPPAVVTEIWTLSKKPELPPHITLGSFEITNKNTLRDIKLYWQKIPVWARNGSKFQYEVFEDGLRSTVRQTPQEYVLFQNLTWKSYRFEIRSANSEGRSNEISVIQVPSSSQAPKGPTSVSKLDYSNGTYEITWHAPRQMPLNPVSYTVYRCLGKGSQCIELLDWVEVDPSKTHYVYRDLPYSDSMHYVFAVSMDTVNMSSGMVIATCDVINDKVPGKLNDVRALKVSADSINLAWKLDCSYKPGLIEKFRIIYCQFVDSTDSCGGDANKQEASAVAGTTQQTLNKLQPFSTYIIWISMVTRVGESQWSDPLLVNTTEAAPSDPPRLSNVDSTNTTATLYIEPPSTPNGIIQEYRLYYQALSGKEVEQVVSAPEDPGAFQCTLEDLEPNANYSLKITACTQFCSKNSTSIHFKTQMGSTKMVHAPTLAYDRGGIVVKWDAPEHVGGPVEYFEVLVKRNGIIVDPESVTGAHRIPYINGQIQYVEHVRLSCESNTNVTAQIRAITKIDEEELFGDWTPTSEFSCYGSVIWYYWVLIVIASFITIFIVGLIILKLYRKYKVMKGPIEIEEPPGMDDQFGIPMSQCNKRSRQSSEPDTYSYCKENLPYQPHNMSSTNGDESKDFLSSDSSKEFDKSGQDSPIMTDSGVDRVIIPFDDSSDGPLLFGNGSDPIWLWQAQIIEAGNDDTELNRFNPVSQLSSPVPTESMTNFSPAPQSTDGLLLDHRISPSPSPPLPPSSSSPLELDCDCGQGHSLLEHYKTVGYTPTGEPLCNGHCRCRRDSDEPESCVDPVTVSISLPLIDSSSSSPEEPSHVLRIDTSGGGTEVPCSSTTRPVPDLLPNGSSPYVRWTELKSDPVNGLTGKLPYFP